MAEAVTKLEVKTTPKASKPKAMRPYQGYEPFEGLRREIDQLFDRFGEGFWRRPFGRSLFDLEMSFPPRYGWEVAPAMDLAEMDEQYEITAELPGLAAGDVEVSVSNGILTIQGEKKEETEEKEKNYYLSERSYGSFRRSFQLPEGVEADKITAVFKEGLLTVALPKMVEAKQSRKTIDVKAA